MLRFTLLLFCFYFSLSVKNTKVVVRKTLKHDDHCFTQGLLFHDNVLYESCGLYEKSSLRKVNPQTGEVLKVEKIDNEIFAEGITIAEDKIWMLTWKNKKLLVFNVETLKHIATLSIDTFNGEGWGLTFDGHQLIASDGTDKILFYDVPNIKNSGKKVIHSRLITVNDPKTSKKYVHINELEYADGFIYANVWYKDLILKIDPSNGVIVSKYDMTNLYPKSSRTYSADCLNGIAFNESDSSFLLTGKQWPSYYKVNFKDFVSSDSNNSVDL